MYLSILIPCLNEEKTIAYCINKSKKFLNSLSKESEILIVDNGSSDRTINIAKKKWSKSCCRKKKRLWFCSNKRYKKFQRQIYNYGRC